MILKKPFNNCDQRVFPTLNILFFVSKLVNHFKTANQVYIKIIIIIIIVVVVVVVVVSDQQGRLPRGPTLIFTDGGGEGGGSEILAKREVLGL